MKNYLSYVCANCGINNFKGNIEKCCYVCGGKIVPYTPHQGEIIPSEIKLNRMLARLKTLENDFLRVERDIIELMAEMAILKRQINEFLTKLSLEKGEGKI